MLFNPRKRFTEAVTYWMIKKKFGIKNIENRVKIFYLLNTSKRNVTKGTKSTEREDV